MSPGIIRTLSRYNHRLDVARGRHGGMPPRFSAYRVMTITWRICAAPEGSR